MTDEAIDDVVARVLARDATGEWMDRTDAVTLAREVARLTEESAKEQMERSDAELCITALERWLIGAQLRAEGLAGEVARLRDGIEALRRDYPNLDWYDVRDRVDALLAPTTETP